MNRSPHNTVNRTRGYITSWLNPCKSLEPSVEFALTRFEKLGYTVLLESDIISGQHQSILQNYCNGILGDRFRQAMHRINPTVPLQQIESIFWKLTAIRPLPLMQHNRQWHGQLLNGIPLESVAIASIPIPTLKLIDFSNVNNNDWLVIHSFPVIEADCQHYLDLVVFINGLPLVVFQGFQAGEEAWSLHAAHLRLQGYKTHLPKFFSFNELLVLSNGTQSRIGTLSAPWKQFIPIHSVNGEEKTGVDAAEIDTLIQGVFDRRRFLEILQHFIVFRQSKAELIKKLRHPAFCTIVLPEGKDRTYD